MPDEEGIASTTESVQPASSLGSEGTQPQVETPSDAWGEVGKGAAQQTPTPAETPAPTTPAAPAPEAASPAPAQTASVSTDAEEDPFDKILDPKKEDFQAIRSNRKEVVEKLKAAEPLAAAVEEIGGAEVLGMVAPLFQPFADLPTGLQTARDFVSKLSSFDPQVDKVLKEAVYEKHKDQFLAWALEDQGMDVQTFETLKAGGAGGPLGTADPAAFPEPDEEGFVQLLDGTVLDTANDSGHKVAYDLAKKDYQREQTITAEKTRQREQAQTAAVQEREQRVQAFATERDTAFDTAFAKLAIDCGPDTETAKELILAMVNSIVGKSEELPRLAAEARRLAAEGGAAAVQKGMAIDRIGQQALATATQKVTALYAELHQLRQQTTGGRPVLPGTQQPSTFLRNDATPPASQGGSSNPIDDIWKSAMNS